MNARRKPRLVVFAHLCNADFVTGAEKLTAFMLRELAAWYECVLAVPAEGRIAEDARAAGFRTVVLPLPLAVSLYLGLPHWRQELRDGMAGEPFRQLVRWLASEEPAAVVVATCVHPLPAVAARALGIPVIWAVMETMRETEHTPGIVAFMGAHADRIVGISGSVLAPFRLPEVQVKTALLPPSWDERELRPEEWPMHRDSVRRMLGVDGAQPLVGFVASTIYANKGFHHYMEATIAAAARHPEARFLIVGNPVDQPYFDAGIGMAREAGVFDRYRWIRHEARIERIYPALDIVVVPSLAPEGFGLTALEGMMFAKPVVSYASGGLAEIHAATGNAERAVPTGDAAALAAALIGLLDRPGELAAIGSRSREAAIAAYGIDAYRARLQAFLAALAPESMPRGMLIRGSGPDVYLRQGIALRRFASRAAFLAAGHRFGDVRQVPDEVIAALPQGPAIGGGASRSPRHRRLRRMRRMRGGRRSLRLRRRALRGRRRAAGRGARRLARRARRAAVRRSASRRGRRSGRTRALGRMRRGGR
jgi:glycosyltransferase involved in cell wall biosynthesis